MQIRPVTGVVGAEVGGVQLADAIDDADLAAALDDALVAHGVLFFRDQELTPDEHVAFGRLFGEPHVHPYAPNLGPEHPEILELVTSGMTSFLDWHADATFEPSPPISSILRALECPPAGGDTLFASAAAAYDALSPVLQERLDDLQAVHSSAAVFSAGGRAGTYSAEPDKDATATLHPVVRRHQVTGRPVLYVNNQFTSHIDGMHPEESAFLLDFLRRHVAHPQFQVRLAWEPDTVAMWDNRQVLHAAVADFAGTGATRRMQRVTVLATAA